MVDEKRKKQMKEYRDKNKEEINRKRREKYHSNPIPYLIARRNYVKENHEKVKEGLRNWWNKNKGKYLEKNKLYNRKKYIQLDKIEYRIKKRMWESKARKTNIQYLTKKRLRLRVWQVLKGIRKEMYDSDFHIDYKPIVEQLITKLPEDFKINPSKYQIDHILPLYKFDLTKKEELLKAFAPENHQWLTLEEHYKKSISERETKRL